MTSSELTDLWTPILKSLQHLFSVLPDDNPQLDQPLWEGSFTDDKGEEKHERAMTTRELMAHLVMSSYEFPAAMCGREDFAKAKEMGEVLKSAAPAVMRIALDERVDKMLAFIAALSDDELAEVAKGPMGEKPVGTTLAVGALHLVHHKGQLAMMARLLGARPGRFLM